MLWGKYKGCKMINVPRRHLKFIYENWTNIRPDLREYIEKRLTIIKQEIKYDNKQMRR